MMTRLEKENIILPIADVSDSAIDNQNGIQRILESKGYELTTRITKTSQGAAWRAIQKDSLQPVVIKIASKQLVDGGYGKISSNKRIKMEENIVCEADILQKLSNALKNKKYKSIRHGVVKYIDFFNDLQNYFLIISDGGQCLNEFVVKCHKLIFAQKLDIKEWRGITRLIFKQIIDFMDFLHHQMNICHMDLCLKNLLIQNAEFIPHSNGTFSISQNFHIVFIDFGVAQGFFGDYSCQRYVGKTRFVSPELFCKADPFDARANDVWSLAICLFVMCIGHNPYNCPSDCDYEFGLIKKGKLSQLLMMMNKESYMTEELMDLLCCMLKKEADRITLNQIKDHSFVRL